MMVMMIVVRIMITNVYGPGTLLFLNVHNHLLMQYRDDDDDDRGGGGGIKAEETGLESSQ